MDFGYIQRLGSSQNTVFALKYECLIYFCFFGWFTVLSGWFCADILICYSILKELLITPPFKYPSTQSCYELCWLRLLKCWFFTIQHVVSFPHKKWRKLRKKAWDSSPTHFLKQNQLFQSENLCIRCYGSSSKHTFLVKQEIFWNVNMKPLWRDKDAIRRE